MRPEGRRGARDFRDFLCVPCVCVREWARPRPPVCDRAVAGRVGGFNKLSAGGPANTSRLFVMLCALGCGRELGWGQGQQRRYGGWDDTEQHSTTVQLVAAHRGPLFPVVPVVACHGPSWPVLARAAPTPVEAMLNAGHCKVLTSYSCRVDCPPAGRRSARGSKSGSPTPPHPTQAR